jgi:dTDP-glucose 4,6-dehydratase
MDKLKKSFIITGCCGLLGSYFTKLCLENDWLVLGIDKKTYCAQDENKLFGNYSNFTFLQEDILTLNRLPDCDYVVNFAAESHVDNSILNSNHFTKTNILGVENLLNLIKEKKNYQMPLFVHISTDEVYGDTTEDIQYNENDKLNPSNPYSASKAAADLLIQSWNRTYNIPYIIFRPTNNYGLGQYPEKLIPKSIQLLMRGKKIQLHGDGSYERDWLYADNTAMNISGILREDRSKTLNQIFNIAGNNIVSIKDVAHLIIKNFHSDDVNPDDYIEYNYQRKGADICYKIDDSKLRNLIGDWRFSNKNKLEDVIQNIIKDIKENYRW